MKLKLLLLFVLSFLQLLQAKKLRKHKHQRHLNITQPQGKQNKSKILTDDFKRIKEIQKRHAKHRNNKQKNLKKYVGNIRKQYKKLKVHHKKRVERNLLDIGIQPFKKQKNNHKKYHKKIQRSFHVPHTYKQILVPKKKQRRLRKQKAQKKKKVTKAKKVILSSAADSFLSLFQGQMRKTTDEISQMEGQMQIKKMLKQKKKKKKNKIFQLHFKN